MNTKDKTTVEQGRRLIPASKWNTFHPWPSVPGLRHLIFNANSNGFDFCIRRIGRRVLIDETRFFEWVDRLNNCPTNDSGKVTQLDFLK